VKYSRIIGYNMIEYNSIPIEWQNENSSIYVLNAFRKGVYKATKLSLLDIYKGFNFYTIISFTDFLRELIYEKDNKDSCPFELIDGDFEIEDINKELIESLKNTSGVNDTLTSINKYFEKLAKVKPFLK